MAIQKENVSVDVQDIIDLLHSGYTWFKKDDLGYGSIQEKFNALDIHIKTIQKHPELANVDTIAKVFVITNRNKTDNGTGTTTNTVNQLVHGNSVELLSENEQRPNTDSSGEERLSSRNNKTIITPAIKDFATAGSTDLSAFANL
jgi:hypothetical protein